MTTRKDLLIAVLATFCLTSTLFTTVITTSQPVPWEYDPWVDLNDDGIIDIFDLVHVALIYGAEGTPINKTALLLNLLARVDSLNATITQLENTINYLNSTVVYLNETVVYLNNTRGLGSPNYDSGWVESHALQTHIFEHNLNTPASELLVYVLGKYYDGTWYIHQWFYGSYEYIYNGVDHILGIHWDSLNNNTIRVNNMARMEGENEWQYVRVKIWKIP